MSNKVISIEYTLTDAKGGETLDSNVGAAPLEFISGVGQIIPGLETKLVEMEADEKADVLVVAAEAYGEYREELLQTLPKEQFAGIDLVEGMNLYGTDEAGQTVNVRVKTFTDADVTVDYNHPMAGRDLMFSVAVLSSRAATDEEIQTGVVGGYAAMNQGGCGCGSGGCSTDSAEGHTHGEKDSCCGGEGHEHKEEGHTCCGGGHCS